MATIRKQILAIALAINLLSVVVYAQSDSPPGDSPGSPPADSPGSPPADSPGSPPGDSPGSPPGDSPGSPPSDSPPSGSGDNGGDQKPGLIEGTLTGVGDLLNGVVTFPLELTGEILEGTGDTLKGLGIWINPKKDSK